MFRCDYGQEQIYGVRNSIWQRKEENKERRETVEMRTEELWQRLGFRGQEREGEFREQLNMEIEEKNQRFFERMTAIDKMHSGHTHKFNLENNELTPHFGKSSSSQSPQALSDETTPDAISVTNQVGVSIPSLTPNSPLAMNRESGIFSRVVCSCDSPRPGGFFNNCMECGCVMNLSRGDQAPSSKRQRFL